MTRWWKCDLQVATPGARDFRGPSDGPWDLQTDAGRRAAAARYMERVVATGVEVLALADHNDASWTEIMVDAGRDVGITVFPGMEVTSGSGSDGVHIIILGGPDRTQADFDALLSGACGFTEIHPRFDPVHGTPASSPRTLTQILDDLPDGYLAIAPHALNDNGVASADTVRGNLRWKALHHDRLAAIDVGDVRNIASETSWHARFARRELTDFPCLPGLAFVSTSDAYELDTLGSRYTWIRMARPTLEALRQASLDHEARIVCDWDPRYSATTTPNDIGHAWVQAVRLDKLTTTEAPVEIKLDPRLTVLIGGRGSGKSSVVAALRCLYGDVDALPSQARAEMDGLLEAVFPDATLDGTHCLAYSGEQQTARWTHETRSISHRNAQESDDLPPDADAMPTDFKVRVINQKELFERAAHSTHDRHATSRNLLSLVDDALATGSAGPGGPAAFDAALAEAQTAWIGVARAHQSELEAAQQLPVVAARVEELTRQVAAFDNPDSVARRQRNDQRVAEATWLDATIADLQDAVDGLKGNLDEQLASVSRLAPDSTLDTSSPEAEDLASLSADVEQVRSKLHSGLRSALAEAESELAALQGRRASGPWQEAVARAVEDAAAYRDELAALGVDAAAYDRVRRGLASETRSLAQIQQRRARLPEMAGKVAQAWSEVEAMLASRHAGRMDLLDEVARRSELLRFTLRPRTDVTAWTARVRELLNLRADGFLGDVPELGEWLWGDVSDDEADRRQQLWREACVTGGFETLGAAIQLRSQWQQRLSGLDDVLRTRLGAEVADDTVAMEFLREGGDPGVDADWKPLTAGSPGQRSAAMLSFVLHHGVEPLVLDQPEDDLDTEWITQLVVRQLRTSRWTRQIVVVTHNANIPVNADAERVIVMENDAGGIKVRTTSPSSAEGGAVEHAGALEEPHVRADIQQILEGGVEAFVRRERRYNNELNTYRAAMRDLTSS